MSGMHVKVSVHLMVKIYSGDSSVACLDRKLLLPNILHLVPQCPPSGTCGLCTSFPISLCDCLCMCVLKSKQPTLVRNTKRCFSIMLKPMEWEMMAVVMNGLWTYFHQIAIQKFS